MRNTYRVTGHGVGGLLPRSASHTVSLVVACLLLFLPVAARAQQPRDNVLNGFRVSPIRSELTIEKGKSQALNINVENPTKTSARVKVVINDFVASGNESGQPRLILDENAPRPRNDFKSLVSAVPEFDLAAAEQKKINITIAVPAQAPSGGYYGAIRFLPADANASSNVGLVASVGSLVLVTVPGNLTEKMDLLQLSAAKNDKARQLFFSGQVSVLTRLRNDGDIHLKPFGRVEVRDMFGRSVAAYELNDSDPRANILPGSTRAFVKELPKQKWLGRYSLTANIGYQQGSGNVLSGRAVFWYLPPWFVLLATAGVLAVTGLIYVVTRRRR